MNQSRDDEVLAVLSEMCGLSPDANLIQLEFLYVCGIPFVAWHRLMVLFEIRVQNLFKKEISEQRFPDYQDGSWSSNFKLGLYGYLSLICKRRESWYPRSLFPSHSTKPVYACTADCLQCPVHQSTNQLLWNQLTKSLSIYDILAQVGEGIFGKVYKARNSVTVARKWIWMETEKNGFPVTAMQEIKLVQSLQHENVVQLYKTIVSNGKLDEKLCPNDYSICAGSIYMVFEYNHYDLTGVLS